MKIKISNRNVASVLFPLAIWLSFFDTFVPGVTIGDILLIVSVLLSITYLDDIKKGRKEARWIVVCVVCQFVLGIIGLLNADVILYSTVVKRVVKFALYITSVWYLRNKLNIPLLFKTLEVMMYIAGICLFFQYALHYLFGFTRNIVYLPFLRYIAYYISSDFNYIFRPSAYFLEPSHLSQFAIPIIIMELYRDGKMKSVIKAVIFTIICLLTTSGVAVVTTVFVWLTYLLYISKKNAKGILAAISLVIIFGGILVFAYYHVPQVNFAVVRLLDTDSIVYTGRITRNSELTDGMRGLTRFIGNGFGNINMNTGYMSSVRYIFYNGGYILTLLWLGIFMKLFFVSGMRGQITILSFIEICFASRIFISMTFAFYLIMIVTDSSRFRVDEKKNSPHLYYANVVTSNSR